MQIILLMLQWSQMLIVQKKGNNLSILMWIIFKLVKNFSSSQYFTSWDISRGSWHQIQCECHHLLQIKKCKWLHLKEQMVLWQLFCITCEILLIFQLKFQTSWNYLIFTIIYVILFQQGKSRSWCEFIRRKAWVHKVERATKVNPLDSLQIIHKNS